MSIFGLILIVAGIIFLAMLGKNGWTPVMRALLVLAVVLLALFVVRTQRVPLAPSFWAPSASVMEQPARITPLFVLFFLGAFGSVVVYQVRRGAWTWPAVVKVGAIVLGAGCLILMGTFWLSQARIRTQDAARTINISTEWPPREAPRMRPVGAPEGSLEARRYRDVEMWRRASVLDFVPFSAKERPDWCREGLETEPESVRLNDTEFLSSLPEDRDWIAGYSSQDPVVTVAENHALAAARRKLALEALLQVKKAVPEFDTLPFENLAWRLAMRHSIGGLQDTYLEKATLVHEQRPYGSVYRAAVRIGADPRTIDYLARRLLMNVDSSGDGRDRDVQGAFFSSLILVALAFSAFLVYVFIRAGATGGWVYPLRFLSGAMLLAVAVAAVYVSVNLGTP